MSDVYYIMLGISKINKTELKLLDIFIPKSLTYISIKSSLTLLGTTVASQDVTQVHVQHVH